MYSLEEKQINTKFQQCQLRAVVVNQSNSTLEIKIGTEANLVGGL